MRTKEEVEARIASITQRQECIKLAKRSELDKPIHTRNKHSFYFYFLEESISKSLLGEIFWYLDEEHTD